MRKKPKVGVKIRLIRRFQELCCGLSSYSVPARAEFLGVIDDPLFENLGVIGKFRGPELFLSNNNFLFVCACILKVLKECPLS